MSDQCSHGQLQSQCPFCELMRLHPTWSPFKDLLAERDRLAAENARLLDLIDKACNALTDSICVSGNDSSTNLHWVRKLKRAALGEEPKP